MAEVTMQESCPHSEISQSGTCYSCGLYIEVLASHFQPGIYASKKKEKSILQKLEKYNLPDDIKKRANEIYKKIQEGGKKNNHSNQLLYYCVVNAYKELGKPYVATVIGSMFDLRQGEMSRAMSKYAYNQTGYRPVISNNCPGVLVKEFAKNFDFTSEMIEDLANFSDRILTNHPEFRQFRPQQVAAAIIYYYANVRISISDLVEEATLKDARETFIKKMGQSWATINVLHKQIVLADNMDV
jgi:hypothetical protein